MLNYEIQDDNHSKFSAGFGMSIQNLMILSDIYGVSCDYLLGTKETSIDELKKFGIDLGLDEDSIAILKGLQKNIGNKNIVYFLNSLIHSIDDEFLDYTKKKSPRKRIKRNLISNQLTKGLADKLAMYLFFSCRTQFIESKKDKDILDAYGQFNLREDEVANILLIELEKDLIQSRENYRKLRKKNTKETEEKINELINSSKKADL